MNPVSYGDQMYEFKPVTEKDVLRTLYGTETGFAYIGYDDGVQTGTCCFELGGQDVEILKMTYPADKPDFGEGLIRSALNFGANRGAYIAKYRVDCCTDAAPVFEKMGFVIEDMYYTGDIPTLLGGCCNHSCG